MTLNMWYVICYVKIIYAFVSAQLKYGVWIKAGLQPFFPAESGGINWLSRSELNQPFRIDSDAVVHMNLIRCIWFGSAEVRRLNWAWATQTQRWADSHARDKTKNIFLYFLPSSKLTVSPILFASYNLVCQIVRFFFTEASRIWRIFHSTT